MLNSSILEVFIGLIFVYSLLAILVTQINTVIANLLNLRAKHLKAGIQALITDPTTQARFLTHPLIGLVKRPLDPNRPLSAQGAEKVIKSETTDRSWIEPPIFAKVIIDLISAQAGDDADPYVPLMRVASTVLTNEDRVRIRPLIRQVRATGEGLDELRAAIIALEDPADRQAMLQALNDVESTVEEYSTDSRDLIGLFQGLRNIKNEEFQRALDTILVSARSVDEARERLEQWFENSMDRVSDAYRQKIQYVSLMVGLLLALVLNVDTLQLARSLWDDSALRGTVAAAALSALETGELAAQMELADPEATPAAVIQPDAEAGILPPEDGESGVVAQVTPVPDITTQDMVDAEGRLVQSVGQTQVTVENLLDLRLPIGWGHTPVVEAATVNPLDPNPMLDTRNLWNYSPANNPDHWFGLVVRKIIGIIITMLAVSQGAPFWFDLLNRIARGGRQN